MLREYDGIACANTFGITKFLLLYNFFSALTRKAISKVCFVLKDYFNDFANKKTTFA